MVLLLVLGAGLLVMCDSMLLQVITMPLQLSTSTRSPQCTTNTTTGGLCPSALGLTAHLHSSRARWTTIICPPCTTSAAVNWAGPPRQPLSTPVLLGYQQHVAGGPQAAQL